MKDSNTASRWPQILAAVSTTIGALGLGCGLGWTSPVLPNLIECQDNPDKPEGCAFDREFTTNEGSWIGSIYTLGALVSGLVTGFLLANIGRKYTMLVMAIPFTAGWILLTLTKPLDLGQPVWFYIGRALTGFGAGSFALAAPIYIMEISEASIRGSLGILMQFMVTTGNVFVNGMGSFIDWPILTGICVSFPVIMAIMMTTMPESPYVLLTKGKENKAKKNLQWLRGSHYDIQAEVHMMKDTFEKQKQIGGISILDLLTKICYLKPFLIMMCLHFIQQFCGINAIVFNLADIFLAAGFDIDNSLAAAAQVSVTQVVATGTSIFLVERMGRKVLLIFSSSIMCIAIFALGVYFYLDDHLEVVCNSTTSALAFATTTDTCVPKDGISQALLDSLGWLPLTTLIIYKFAFSIGYGPLPWMMNGEFFPLEAKALSASICTAFNWLCAFLVSKYWSNLREVIGLHGVYFIFALICLLATFFVLYFVPETKGKTAEDMKRYFQGGKKAVTIKKVEIEEVKKI